MVEGRSSCKHLLEPTSARGLVQRHFRPMDRISHSPAQFGLGIKVLIDLCVFACVHERSHTHTASTDAKRSVAERDEGRRRTALISCKSVSVVPSKTCTDQDLLLAAKLSDAVCDEPT